MSSYESSVYYSPESHNLTKVAELDLSEPDYSFDILCVWKDNDTGRFLYATDSGCSCPSPFEDVNSKDELAEFTWTAVEAEIRDAEKSSYRGPTPTDVAHFKEVLKGAGA